MAPSIHSLPQPLKVVLSASTHWWNAEAAYAANLAQALIQAGQQVWTLSPPSGAHAQALEEKHIPQLSIPHWPHSPLAAWKLRQFLRQENIHILHLFRSQELFASRCVVRGLPCRLIRTRGSNSPMQRSCINRSLLSGCQAIVACSQQVRQDMLRALHPLRPHIPVIYYPAPVSGMLPSALIVAECRQQILQQFSLSPDALLLAVVGRIAPEKGHLLLFQALTFVLPQCPKLTVLLLNKDHGPRQLHRQLRQYAQKQGIASHIHWLGWRKDTPAIMASADLGVIPSITSEVNCRIAMEFFAAKTPVVAFPTGAMGEVLQHQHSAWLTKSHHPQQLAEGILQMLQQPKLRAKFADNAYQLAQSTLSQQHFIQQYLQIYQQVLSPSLS